jgi:flagellar hook-associated protein 1 FlgK
MSLNLALGNALSGLGATARMAEVVSSNLANALTEGYARRSVALSAQSLDGRGAGVRMDGLTRHADRALLAERRGAESALTDRRTLASALRGIEGDLGSSDGGTSLAERIKALESALVSAAADPSSETRLAQALNRLNGVAEGFRDNAAAVQRRRGEADAAIARDVGDLNGALGSLARLNADIGNALAQGRDATALMDQRQVLLDKVGRLVPVREMERPNGGLALVTLKGAMLLDGTRAATVGFTPTPVVTADMTLASGALSGLTIDGEPAGTDGVGRLAGGSLGAAFALRDRTLPAFGTRLDAMARDLLERVEDPATDPSRGAAPALLTDAGGALDPLDTVGLASRLKVNAAVDPDRGGALRRLRDGIAAPPGPAAEAGQLRRWLSALETPRVLSTGGGSGSAATLAGGLAAEVGAQRLAAEEEESFANARWSTLRESELSGGVDSDQEMQMLLQIEKAYAANARVIATVDAMMQSLLEI